MHLFDGKKEISKTKNCPVFYQGRIRTKQQVERQRNPPLEDSNPAGRTDKLRNREYIKVATPCFCF